MGTSLKQTGNYYRKSTFNFPLFMFFPSYFVCIWVVSEVQGVGWGAGEMVGYFGNFKTFLCLCFLMLDKVRVKK